MSFKSVEGGASSIELVDFFSLFSLKFGQSLPAEFVRNFADDAFTSSNF